MALNEEEKWKQVPVNLRESHHHSDTQRTQDEPENDGEKPFLLLYFYAVTGFAAKVMWRFDEP
jgi:hypothetical protein